MLIEAPGALEQSLAPQDLVNSRDAADEGVRGIEYRTVRVSQCHALAEELAVGSSARARHLDAGQQLHGRACPDRPLSQQPAIEPANARFTTDRHCERRDQIGYDVVVVPGVERDI